MVLGAAAGAWAWARGWGWWEGGCEGGVRGWAGSNDGAAEEGVPAGCEEVAFVVAHFFGRCVLGLGCLGEQLRAKTGVMGGGLRMGGCGVFVLFVC